eukprot:139078_1
MSTGVATFEEKQSIIIISGYIRLYIDLSTSTIVPDDIIKLCYLFYRFTKVILAFEHKSGYNCIGMDDFSNINLQIPISFSCLSTIKSTTTKCMANEIQWKYPSIIYWDQLKYTSYSGIFEINKQEGQSAIILFETNKFQQLMHDKNTENIESFRIYLPRLPSKKCDMCLFDKEYGLITFSGTGFYQLIETNSGSIVWRRLIFKPKDIGIDERAISHSVMTMVENSLFATNKRNSFLYDFQSNTENKWKLLTKVNGFRTPVNLYYNYRKNRVYCIYENYDVLLYETINDFWREHSKLKDIGGIGSGRYNRPQISQIWMNHDSDSILYYMDHNETHIVYYLDEREEKYKWKKHDEISQSMSKSNVKEFSAIFS